MHDSAAANLTTEVLASVRLKGDSWVTSIDWGDAPTWVGALLTSATLFLTIMILVSDKRRARRIEASKVVSRFKLTGPAAGWWFTVNSYNANDHPIPMVVVHQWEGEEWRPYPLQDLLTGDLVIGPRGEGEMHIPARSTDPRNLYLTIQDGNGEEWHRTLTDGRFIGPVGLLLRRLRGTLKRKL